MCGHFFEFAGGRKQVRHPAKFVYDLSTQVKCGHVMCQRYNSTRFCQAFHSPLLGMQYKQKILASTRKVEQKLNSWPNWMEWRWESSWKKTGMDKLVFSSFSCCCIQTSWYLRSASRRECVETFTQSFRSSTHSQDCFPKLVRPSCYSSLPPWLSEVLCNSKRGHKSPCFCHDWKKYR